MLRCWRGHVFQFTLCESDLHLFHSGKRWNCYSTTVICRESAHCFSAFWRKRRPLSSTADIWDRQGMLRLTSTNFCVITGHSLRPLLQEALRKWGGLNPRPCAAYFITRTCVWWGGWGGGGVMHSPRVSKLRVLELSEKNSGLLSTSTRD